MFESNYKADADSGLGMDIPSDYLQLRPQVHNGGQASSTLRRKSYMEETMVSKEQLDAALGAWETARDKSLLEQEAWGILNQSHSALISSLRQHGHTWTQAEAEFERLSQAHRDSLIGAWTAMDERCREYHELRQKFKNE